MESLVLPWPSCTTLNRRPAARVGDGPLVVDDATGDWSLRVPPASIVTLLGGIALVTAHLANLRCGAHCRN
jgi:hypothetical protein